MSINQENQEYPKDKFGNRIYTLDELVAGMTAENSHPETYWGRPVGSERFWEDEEEEEEFCKEIGIDRSENSLDLDSN